ncbi:IS5 family transposase [Streptomyces sp. NPDC127106]|uniref:IS5 family transposase n=1 Tax=Streptomyces sp. NPDC127106 TaxID=3345360 RepID=UPI00363CCF9D
MRYLVAGGISWRAMPADFPAWARVYAFFRRWREHGLIAEFHDRLRGTLREREGREAEPTAGIIDAQSVRAAATVPAVSRGYDGGKKVPGRKRHTVTDTLGLLLAVAVTAANIGDRDAAADLLIRLRRLHRDITLVWADRGYTGSLVGWCRDKLALTLEIVKRIDDMAGFMVLPRRWVAERTFAWLMNSRRLARDRNPARHQRGDDPVVDGHADEPASATATVRRPALNAPDTSRRSHPRSARRPAFDRSPSTFAGVASRPSSTAISLARSGP